MEMSEKRTIRYTQLHRSISQIMESILRGEDKYTTKFVEYPEPEE